VRKTRRVWRFADDWLSNAEGRLKGCWRKLERQRVFTRVVDVVHRTVGECSMHASFRILVVNSAPFPKPSHARCANIREPGNAMAAIAPQCSFPIRSICSIHLNIFSRYHRVVSPRHCRPSSCSLLVHAQSSISDKDREGIVRKPYSRMGREVVAVEERVLSGRYIHISDHPPLSRERRRDQSSQ